jgi:protein-S-isoprenylcysteine O-methyltransferase Ste14
MRENIIKFLLHFSNRRNSLFYKTISLFGGTIFFLLILPSIFIWIGYQIDNLVSINGNLIIRDILSITAIIVGLFFLIWATYTQIMIGKGTPAPNAPTQRLIISGPYRLTRNPIELGAVIYYFGLGTFIQSYTVGLICLMLGLIIGSLYHKLIEEKELEVRFGDDYIKYKKDVPFLIPRLKNK